MTNNDIMKHAIIKATTYKSAIALNHCCVIGECATRDEAITIVRQDYFIRLEEAVSHTETHGDIVISLACCDTCMMSKDARAEAVIRLKQNEEEETTTWAIREMSDMRVTIDFYNRNGREVVSRQPIMFATKDSAKHWLIDHFNGTTSGEELVRYADMLNQLEEGCNRLFYYGTPQTQH